MNSKYNSELRIVNHYSRNTQGGYTLLELMIAGTIGLILLLGVMQIYLSASRTNNFQASVIEVQDKGRFILTILEKDLQRAGWSNLNPGVDLGTLDAHIDFDLSSDGGSSGDDSITIQYEADPDADVLYNCSGETVVAGNLIKNRYFVQDGSFRCQGYVGSTAGTSVALIDGIESFQILYGVDDTSSTPEGDGIVDGYATASQIGTNFREEVATVRIGILIRSTDEPLTQENDLSFQILDQEFDAVSDRALRRAYSKTIVIPNKPQAF